MVQLPFRFWKHRVTEVTEIVTAIRYPPAREGRAIRPGEGLTEFLASRSYLPPMDSR